MTTPALTIRDLSVRYHNGVTAIDGLHLSVAAGEAVALVGESGSGKSTVVLAVLGLLPRTARRTGQILLAGQDLTALNEAELRRRRGTGVGYVAQDPYGACDPVWPVAHHVGEAWYAHRRRPGRGTVARRLANLGITGMRLRRPYAWSGGMLQRATIAAATAHQPPLLVADEPTSALDADLADDALGLLRRQANALLLVSHDLDLATRHCDRVLVLRHGRLVEQLPGRQPAAGLAVTARHPYTRELLAALPTPRTPSVHTARPAVAQLSGVTLRAGRRRTLAAGVDLTVHRNEIVGLVGPSGVGKTSLLHTLAGLRAPAAGIIRYADRSTPPPGYVMAIFQDASASLDPRWPIWRTVAEPDPTGDRDTAVRLLSRVGLSALDSSSRPGELSGGQQQRVAIARALAARPVLLVADEPIARLDPTTAAGICILLRELADEGTAIVVASHDRARLASLADRLVRLTGEALQDSQLYLNETPPC